MKKKLSRWKRFKKNTKEWVIRSAEKPLQRTLEQELAGCESVLDVGSGVHSKLSEISRPYYLVGIDLLPPSRVESKIHDKYIRGDIRNLGKYFKKKSFDGAIVIDVIEHLTKKDALKLLQDLDVIVKKKIIILTPTGFHHQDEIHDNPYMKHLSGWQAKEFEQHGYVTHGLHGFKFIRGEEAGIKYKPWYVWLYLSHLSQYIAHFFPATAFHIIAVKTLDRQKRSHAKK